MPSKKKPPVSTNHSSAPKQPEVNKTPKPETAAPYVSHKPKVNRVGSRVTYRAAISQDGKWVDGPGEMDRQGYVISWGTRWVTILNLDARKIEYAVLSSAQLEPEVA